MVTFFSWVLLIFTVLDIVFAFGQLVVMRGLKLIVDKTTELQVWSAICFPVVTFIVTSVIVAHPASRLPVLSAGLTISFILFGVGLLIQGVSLLEICDRNRERDAQIKSTIGTFNSRVVDPTEVKY